jgi:outer membrane PBP1 activator LpoA protein
VVTQHPYSNDYQEIASAIQELLKLEGSKARHQALTRQLGRRLHFEPRLRDDFDFIFMAAFPRQARQLRPQLRFHGATDIPLYATSHVYGGVYNPEADRDLDGVMFGDMPWILESDIAEPALHQSINAHWGKRSATYGRLFALGIDAFNVLSHLGPLRAGPYAQYQGVTGRLRLDAEGRLRRGLTWATFEGGQVRTLDSAPEAL